MPSYSQKTSFQSRIIGISRHRVMTDGQGVTTLVAFHGCILKCVYCINSQCHDSEEKFPVYTPEQLYNELLRDDLYMYGTGGGVTFGGGEPLLHAEFIREFKKLCGDRWRVTVETSLMGPRDAIHILAPIVDEWIVDIKTTDSQKYKEYTGSSSMMVRANLEYLTDGCGVSKDKILIRIPEIPGFTDSRDVEESRRYFEEKGFERFDIFRYTTETQGEGVSENTFDGKTQCERLKQIRREIGLRNGIEVEERECSHQGNCPGTCPRCEADVAELSKQLNRNGYATVDSEFMEQFAPRRSDARRPDCEDADNDKLRMGQTVLPISDDKSDPMHVLGDIHPGFIEPPLFSHEPELRYKRVFFKECAVAGVSYHVKYDDELWTVLENGTKLALIRERDNKYDSNAVAVALGDDFDGEYDNVDFDCILGYIPRAENFAIAAMMDAGYADKFEAEITTYKSFGSINDRIRITIWLLSREPVEVRPDTLRFQSVDADDCRDMVDELKEHGTMHFYWDTPINCKFMPIVGEDIVLVYRNQGKATLYLTKILAVGKEAEAYVDADEFEDNDGDVCYVLTNVAGPVITSESMIESLGLDAMTYYSAFNKSDRQVSDSVKEYIKKRTEYWISE